MKRYGILVFTVVLMGLMVSCVSLQDRTMSPQEQSSAEVVGSVTAEFTSFQFLHIPNKTKIRNKVYVELKKAAVQEYGTGADVKNIFINGNFSLWEIPYAVGMAGVGCVAGYGLGVAGLGYYGFVSGVVISSLIGNIQRITAYGDVVLASRRGNLLANISQTLIERLPEKSTIAVLSISSSNRNDSEDMVNELEYRLVNSGKFMIVDRRRLDQIRSEQNFQLSGEVDDNSAVSIGNMLGANIVLTGNISISGTAQWLSIKALDVKTARIIAMAREQI